MAEKALIAYFVWNIIVFAVYGIDKLKAKMDAFRIPEKTLILLAAFFGAIGAWAGMRVFRHKTKTTKFTVTVPILAFLNVAIIFMLLYLTDNMGII